MPVSVIAGTNPKKTKSNTTGMEPTAITKAVRSPELEATSNDFLSQLDQVARQTQQAYQGKQGTYDDLIRSMTNIYGAQTGRTATAAQSSALASGLTPLEASQIGGTAVEQLLQQFFPQKAEMATQQADVGVQASEANRRLTGDYGNFIQSVLAPYMKGVAGTEQFDILGQQQFAEDIRRYEEALLQRDEDIAREQEAMEMSLQSDMQKELLRAMLTREGYDIDRMALAQKGDLARMSEEGALERLLLGEMGQTQRTAMGETGATNRMRETTAARSAESGMDREQQMRMAFLQNLFGQDRMKKEQDYRTGEREATQDFRSGETQQGILGNILNTLLRTSGQADYFTRSAESSKKQVADAEARSTEIQRRSKIKEYEKNPDAFETYLEDLPKTERNKLLQGASMWDIVVGEGWSPGKPRLGSVGYDVLKRAFPYTPSAYEPPERTTPEYADLTSKLLSQLFNMGTPTKTTGTDDRAKILSRIAG